jgi:hypothetical protein
MIKIATYSPEDGYAFLQIGDRYLHTRPPFEEDKADSATEGTVARSFDYGFELGPETEFPTWESVVTYLRETQAQACKKLVGPRSNEEIVQELLRVSPASSIERHINRVRNELIPQEKYTAARIVLARLLKYAPILAEHPALREQAEALLKTLPEEPPS